MAHFAELDENNTVIRVIVVDNENVLDANGEESEAVGIAYCKSLLGGEWVQTSYNGRVRGKYAAIGDTYDAVLDEFLAGNE